MREYNPFILLVEDDSLLADITAFRLELLGYDVQTVESVEEAWDICDEYQVDMVIIDLELASMKALQLIKQLKSHVEIGLTPVLVLSTDPNLEIVQQAIDAGAGDHLMTPYDPAILEHKVGQLLSRETVS